MIFIMIKQKGGVSKKTLNIIKKILNLLFDVDKTDNNF